MKFKPSSLDNLIIYIQQVLNAHRIYHYFYSVFRNSNSVYFYVNPEYHDKVFKMFNENLDCKTIDRGIDGDGEYWIQIDL